MRIFGEGANRQERIEDIVSKSERMFGWGNSGEGEVEIMQPQQFSRQNVFVQKPMHDFTLNELQEFPRYLSDLILRPKFSIVSAEHFNYWAWTVVAMKNIDSTTDILDNFRRFDNEKRLSPGDSMIVPDFYNIVKLLQMPLKTKPRGDLPSLLVNEVIPMAMRMDIDFEMSSFLRIFGPSSLSILDGLVTRRCNDIGKDGHSKEGKAISAPWLASGGSVTGLNLHHRLQVWRCHEASQTVEETLSSFNEISRYNPTYLRRLIGIRNRDELDKQLSGGKNFIGVFGDLRNYNMHGSGSSSIIAPLALSFCCLLFWDLVDRETYDNFSLRLIEELKNSVRNDNLTNNTEYYPLFGLDAQALMEE